MTTPYGPPSGPALRGRSGKVELLFLARHGLHLLPHQINYRANLWMLKELGVERVIAVNATGGISAEMNPGRIAIPGQLIDYTWGRESSFFSGEQAYRAHVDFTQPYCAELRRELCEAGLGAGIEVHDGGTYAATQGPRLESAAEIQRLQRDGCDIVGMTGMPEAVLARELELPYACCALVSNWAAGISTQAPDLEHIKAHLRTGMKQVQRLLYEWLRMHTP